MTFYLGIFAIFGLCSLVIETAPDRKEVSRSLYSVSVFLFALALASIFVMISFRWRTGGDWGNYRSMIDVVSRRDLSTALSGTDPGFAAVLYFAGRQWGGMLFVQLVSASALCVGLWSFCRSMPRPWLALTVALPYLVIVVGMGYIRQAIAISFFMMAWTAYVNRRLVSYIILILIGSLFHFTALILLPLFLFGRFKNGFIKIIVTAIVIFIIIYSDTFSRADPFFVNYVDTEMNSSGAGVRLFMTALPSAIFLLWMRQRLELPRDERAAVTILSIAGLTLSVGLIFTSASTAIDRLALYLLPLQIYVWSHLPGALSPKGTNQKFAITGIAGIYGGALFVWLEFATHSRNWIPYRFYF